MGWLIHCRPERIPGLLYRPLILKNRWRWPPQHLDTCGRPPDFNNKVKGRDTDFSACNLKRLKAQITRKTRCIVEIGVSKGGEKGYHRSSTRLLIKHKPKGAIYLGIDLQAKDFLRKKKQGVHALQADSGDWRRVTATLRDLGCDAIDLLVIDGHHSLEQVLLDWGNYVPWLAKRGRVVMHDTNCHPGPQLVFEAIDPVLFDARRYCTKNRDWGIAVARLKKGVTL